MSHPAPPAPRSASFLQAFLKSEALGGYVLMLAACWRCSSPAGSRQPTSTRWAPSSASAWAPSSLESVLHWINDGLMAVFFLLVGLEIKREVLDGQLRGASRIVLPGIAALGGMIMPALIYVLINLGSPGTRGWAIPAATDIAFALGILALLGSRVPTSLKIFLTALAILDDLAPSSSSRLFYYVAAEPVRAGMAAALLAILFCLNRAGVLRLTPYLLLGAVLWYFVLKSGVHATLAGVALALAIPLRPQNQGAPAAHSPLHALEHALHKPVALLIVPIFGFANAGVSFAGMGLDSLAQPVPLGVALGLFLGKQLGVFGFAWLAIKAGVATLPRHASYAQLYGVALLCGIGFTEPVHRRAGLHRSGRRGRHQARRADRLAGLGHRRFRAAARERRAARHPPSPLRPASVITGTPGVAVDWPQRPPRAAMKAPAISLQRIYEGTGPDEAYKALVDRMCRAACAAPTWPGRVGARHRPSAELCKWFGHVDERWDEFCKRYNAELATPEQQARMSALLQAAGKRPLTLLYGARNTEHNQAVALREALLAHARKRRARAPDTRSASATLRAHSRRYACGRNLSHP